MILNKEILGSTTKIRQKIGIKKSFVLNYVKLVKINVVPSDSILKGI